MSTSNHFSAGLSEKDRGHTLILGSTQAGMSTIGAAHFALAALRAVFHDMDVCYGECGSDYVFQELSTETVELLHQLRSRWTPEEIARAMAASGA